MSQQVDLDELTRLNKQSGYNSIAQLAWLNAITAAFPAIRDELVRLQEQNGKLASSLVKSAEDYVAMREVDRGNQNILAELSTQLDEAKGSATELMNQTANWEHMTLSGEEPTLDELRNLKQAARAFLTSLKGRGKAPRLDEGHLWQSNDRCRYCGVHRLDACAPCAHTPKQEQPTQGDTSESWNCPSCGKGPHAGSRWNGIVWECLHGKERVQMVKHSDKTPHGEWHPMSTAPKDGTSIRGKYGDTDCAIRWSQRPVCMLGPVNGGFPPGWATDGSETDSNLPMDEPEAWRPEGDTPQPTQGEVKYTGHPYCHKCRQSHWMHGSCPTPPPEVEGGEG